MRRITTTLALILCLVLCAFAFVSCGKKGDAAGTTAAPATSGTQTTATQATQPAHVHTPEDKYTVELKPTCSTPGRQSLYCSECGEKIEGSTVDIPIDPKAHQIDEWEVTEAVDMFHTTGHRNGKCKVCEETIVEEITFQPVIEAFDDLSGKYNSDKLYFADIRGEDHFYPTESNPDGNDLYVEFSILWNESLKNFDASANPYIVGRFDDGKPFWYLSPVVGCPTSDAMVAGAFEWMGNFKTPISDAEVDTPTTIITSSDKYEDYPNIMGADKDHPEYGWHRVGVRYHLELTEDKSGEDLKDYVGTVTVYLDGTAIYKLSTGDLGMQIWESMLFKAETDEGGNVEYSDSDENNVLYPLQVNCAKALEGKTVYFVYADLYVTCGKGFVMQVERAASPDAEAKLTVAEGVEIPAPVYFQLVEN